MNVIKMNDSVIAPKELVCPACYAPLSPIHATAWSRQDDGWVATEIDFSCESEPDIDGPHWRGWFRNHFRMPYVDWMSLHHKIIEWMERNYRFVCED